MEEFLKGFNLKHGVAEFTNEYCSLELQFRFHLHIASLSEIAIPNRIKYYNIATLKEFKLRAKRI